nr:MAG TPA: hypothetical protein [Caudoviricetes sp.]
MRKIEQNNINKLDTNNLRPGKARPRPRSSSCNSHTMRLHSTCS